jgi:RNA polymerase sigma-70 factor (ECF subfamily)
MLVRRYLRPAYAVALARLGDPADAEDVCQDAFVTALERLESCRRPAGFGGWLLTIVRNRAVDFHRRRAVRETQPLETTGEAVAAAADPERDAERTERREELLRALRLLTERQREVLLLYDFEGWSHKEIAERLGISEGSARVHLHNGRRALRELLGDRPTEAT